MGGGGESPGGHYPYPKWVWAPSGWWPHPRKWKINTAVAIFGLVLIQYPIYLYGKKRERVIIDLQAVDELAEARHREIMATKAAITHQG